jgi:hypothetical protein
VPSSSLQALLTRAGAALLRGRGAEAAQLLAPAFRSTTLTRDEELAVRSMMAEATLLQDDLDQAAAPSAVRPTPFAIRCRRAASRRCGGCTAVSRRRAAISRAPSACSSAR